MPSSSKQTEQIATWKQAFRDETTGIHKTVRDLIWNYAAFRTTIRIVRLANEKREEHPRLNQMLFDLISDGYWSSLLVGIRRLLDKGPIKGPKGVYSIRSVVKDVEQSRPWLTRRKYIEEVLEARYDLTPMLEEQHQRLIAAKGAATWGDPDLFRSEIAHEQFDFLSGVLPTDRRADDLIDPAVLARIEKRLASLDTIGDHVNSHLAHAGNHESRQGKSLANFDIRDAQRALRELKQISDLTGVWFANEGGGGLATFIGDQFAGLDEPLVDTEQIAQLLEHWREIDREVANWSITPKEL
ncbi:hypothetical protein SAMN05892877_104354 [Rhizobium subbaraonis]|uniref:HEPN AbiU2-like domain-containing protein n=2 Tax=Rhizobiaceae TaxID=82115 RepID=A0A285U949_9HYPH|nr:hypothetical protein FLX27_06510 [Agrobacterium tumefaciens]CDN94488.1 hypothetical protein BN949_03658 [Agrobacterium tumefaciens]SOC37918.1 hypothetical protein SAMN05892877_104354 [Rhizobium subbaraonis]